MWYFYTPNGVAMKQVPELLDKGIKVIDLAADYRLKILLNGKMVWYGACQREFISRSGVWTARSHVAVSLKVSAFSG